MGASCRTLRGEDAGAGIPQLLALEVSPREHHSLDGRSITSCHCCLGLLLPILVLPRCTRSGSRSESVQRRSKCDSFSWTARRVLGMSSDWTHDSNEVVLFWEIRRQLGAPPDRTIFNLALTLSHASSCFFGCFFRVYHADSSKVSESAWMLFALFRDPAGGTKLVNMQLALAGHLLVDSLIRFTS